MQSVQPGHAPGLQQQVVLMLRKGVTMGKKEEVKYPVRIPLDVVAKPDSK